jgi:hypothetical protein
MRMAINKTGQKYMMPVNLLNLSRGVVFPQPLNRADGNDAVIVAQHPTVFDNLQLIILNRAFERQPGKRKYLSKWACQFFHQEAKR